MAEFEELDFNILGVIEESLKHIKKDEAEKMLNRLADYNHNYGDDISVVRVHHILRNIIRNNEGKDKGYVIDKATNKIKVIKLNLVVDYLNKLAESHSTTTISSILANYFYYLFPDAWDGKYYVNEDIDMDKVFDGYDLIVESEKKQ